MSEAGPDHPIEPAAPAARQARRRPVIAVAVAVTLVVVVVAGAVVLTRRSAASAHAFVIPPGTQAAIAAGDDVEIIPAELHLQPDDELTITNDDTSVHSIGLFTVRPGETVDYRFPNPGVFRGACTVHPTGSLTIYVE